MNVNGAVPVNVNVTSGCVAPAQTVPPPLTDAVGAGLITTEAVPPKDVAAQPLLSVKAVTWYVPAAGFGMVNVVEGWLVTVIGVVPSV